MKKLLITLIVLALFIVGCSAPEPVAEEIPVVWEAVDIPYVEQNVSFLAVGDNLIHNTIYNEAYARGGDHYDFEFLYQHVDDMIGEADLSFINQETLTISPPFDVASYPQFVSPKELGLYLAEIGFDLISTANNHSIDAYASGMRESIAFWDETGLCVAGIEHTIDDFYEIKTVTRDGIVFSFLAFTESTNGLPIPADGPYVITTAQMDLMTELVAKAKAESDVCIVSVHFGWENTTTVNSNQEYIAQKLVDAGCDLLLGTHPHVLQRIEYMTAADGREAFVTYSLANFAGAQRQNANNVGGILTLDFVRESAQSDVSIENVQFIPTVIDNPLNGDISIIPLSDYTDAQAANHISVYYDYNFTLDYINGLVESVIDEQFLPK